MCIGWLMQRAGGLDVTPTLPVSDMEAATQFYEAAGFDVRRYDDAFAFVTFDEQSVFDLDQNEYAVRPTNGAGCYIITRTSTRGMSASSPLDSTSPRSRTCRGACTSSPSPIPAATTFAVGWSSDQG